MGAMGPWEIYKRDRLVGVHSKGGLQLVLEEIEQGERDIQMLP